MSVILSVFLPMLTGPETAPELSTGIGCWRGYNNDKAEIRRPEWSHLILSAPWRVCICCCRCNVPFSKQLISAARHITHPRYTPHQYTRSTPEIPLV